MSVSRETVEYVARLAYVGVEPAEVPHLAEELSAVLDHLARLNSVDTGDVPPTSHAVELGTVMREDRVTPCLPLTAALANAPRQRDGMFEVQAILD
jgi:aspartyl-tRNA(Asn)/glutamyl-tRNA(Gln) amidotransferase subunit C